MQSYQWDEEAYSVHSRTLPSPSRPPRANYSPRFERRKPKAGSLTNGIHRRCGKRTLS